MRHTATVRHVGAPKEEPKFLVRLAATATSGTGAIDGESSGSRRTSVPDAQILAASRQDGRRKQPEARSCFIARTAYRCDVLSAGGERLDSRIGVGGVEHVRLRLRPGCGLRLEGGASASPMC